MRSIGTAILIALIFIFSCGGEFCQDQWITVPGKGYTLHFTEFDKKTSREYVAFIDQGIQQVTEFFSDTFRREFGVYIHPDRSSMDSQWQKDWNMPDFRSECWMVASGVAGRLDILSPQKWKTEACEHNYAETENTRRLITHELIHVHHGQLNASPDFSNTENIDWFVEGLAVYASGQCDSARLSPVRTAVMNDQTPTTLDEFWTGKLKYGLSGSVIMYIDKKFGRTKLKALLPFNKKTEILRCLGLTESELLSRWKASFQ
jgi:hypothetical protein